LLLVAVLAAVAAAVVGLGGGDEWGVGRMLRMAVRTEPVVKVEQEVVSHGCGS
jgi:hypothetical protein